MSPMTPSEERAHVRQLADARCQRKHPEVHDALILVESGSQHFGPPCDDCMREMEVEYSDKRGKMQGRLLSPDETRALRVRLGLPPD